MTNEELAAAVQAGDRDKLPELWERVERLVWKQAYRVRSALGDGRIADMDDFMQAGFLGLLAAVERYDPAAGLKLTTYLGPALKTAFAEATGWRTEKQRNDPSRNALSLDEPMDSEDSGGDTRGDLVADTADPYEAVDERLYREWLRDFFRAELDKLDPEQAEALRLRYWERLTLSEAGKRCATTPERIRQRETQALRKLRGVREIRRMREYVDQRTDFYRGGRDPVTANVLWREELEERFVTQ